jgi:hypothetical protein
MCQDKHLHEKQTNELKFETEILRSSSVCWNVGRSQHVQHQHNMLASRQLVKLSYESYSRYNQNHISTKKRRIQHVMGKILKDFQAMYVEGML